MCVECDIVVMCVCACMFVSTKMGVGPSYLGMVVTSPSRLILGGLQLMLPILTLCTCIRGDEVSSSHNSWPDVCSYMCVQFLVHMVVICVCDVHVCTCICEEMFMCVMCDV